MYKLNCSTIFVVLITAVSVFLGNLAHSEFLSQRMKSKKTYQKKDISLLHLDDTITTTTEIEYK